MLVKMYAYEGNTIFYKGYSEYVKLSPNRQNTAALVTTEKRQLSSINTHSWSFYSHFQLLFLKYAFKKPCLF